jgi:hypothetical protein
VVVLEVRGHRELWLRRDGRATLQSRVACADPLVSGLPYTDGFHLFAPPTGPALFIGAGAAITPHQFAAFYPDVHVEVVEHDPDVVAAARDWFGLDEQAVRITDGRAALERASEGAYGLIVVDAFGAGDFPGRLATVEFFRLCRSRLREPGVLAVNLVGTLRPGASDLAAVYAGIVAAFGAQRTALHGVPLGGAYDPGRQGNTLAFGFVGAPPTAAAGVPPAHRARLPHLDAIAALALPPLPPVAPLVDADVAEALEIR